MLQRLQVRNFVLIDSLEIDFPEGLVIITGQTGAGKSILLGALSLVMGAKADAGMISDGAESCVVEAEFDVSGQEDGLQDILAQNDVDWDNGHLIVRRIVNRSGRSRAFVNDSPVQLSVLQTVASRLVDIHSQHQTLLLSDRHFQLSVLDHFADCGQLLSDCSASWRRLVSLRSDIKSLEEQIAMAERDRDYNEARFRQLDTASLRDGELAELEDEQKQLANAEEIKSSLCAVEDAFSPSDDERTSLDSMLKDASRNLVRVARFIPSASSLAERVDSCRLELDDILSEVSSLNSGTNLSQSRLEEVEARMSLIYGLMQRHSCSGEKELLELRDKLSETICDSDLLSERLSNLNSELAKEKERYEAIASSLHQRRLDASSAFSASIQDSIRALELPYAVFDVQLSDTQPGASGRDAVVFRFSANGSEPADIAKCASGGELSRIMLSLKAMMARFTKMPTMIFDEIDTGVSGSVADKIGSLLSTMGQTMQVFAITHLPQVAAKGKAHYLVSKDVDPAAGKAVSTITRLGDRDRVMELARMLSGSRLTEAAIANAESLLKDN
ncbi:MAG: DNA repair protein RecN [Candidatus Cryptobacteroides sp.]